MKSTTLSLSLGISIAGGITLTWFTYRLLRKRCNRKQHPITMAWEPLGTLKEIALYPVKSGAALELEAAKCDESGLNYQGFHDRYLILLNDKDEIIYAGVYPLMLSINSQIVSEQIICVTAPKMAPLTINLNEILRSDKPEIVKPMKGYKLKLVECNSVHHEWFSQVILQQNRGLRLYIKLDKIIEEKWWRKSEHDIMPIMVMHDKSVEELNTRLLAKNRSHHQQFRGNLFVESNGGTKHFDEDNWLWLKIGNDTNTCTILRYNSACLRCILVNVDILSCVRNADFEPLKTLRKFRLRDHPKDPEMGIYFDVYKRGDVKQGDPVYVQYKH